VINDGDEALKSTTDQQYGWKRSEENYTSEENEEVNRMSEEEDYEMSEEEGLEDFDWLELIHAKVTLASSSASDNTKTGHVHGKPIRRHHIKQVFHYAMEQPTETIMHK
jgi:hypothetical protein